jgi:tetratricopeptide (TPR) repeat protein
VLAISFHGFSLIFFPALVYILYKKTPLGNLPIHSIPRWIYFIVGVIAIASFYLLGPLFDFGFFLPLKDELNNKRMLLFSVTHLWEFLNAIILGGGGTFLLLLMIFPFVVMNKDENKPVSNFLMLASFFSIGFVFTLDAMRGSGDWDLFAIALIPANILVPYFLINGQTFISKRGVYILLFSGLIFNAFNTSAWININHTDKSISKIKKMLVHDPGSYYVNSFQSEPGLALNFKFNGLMDEAFEMHELAYRKYGNTCGKCVYNYGYDLINNKRTEEGVAILEYVVSTFPFYPYSYLALINHYASVEDNANAFRIALLLFNNYKKNNTEFDKNIKKDELKNIFSNLYNYEIYRGNTSKALEISAVLSKLNAGQ